MNFIRQLMTKQKENESQTIILDTSALKSKNVLKVMEEASKVILLCGIIEEMDKHKDENNLFGANIREVSRNSRKDEESKKYICVVGYEKHSYNDKNIIDYCKEHKKTIIVTSDNNLCNFAKAYGIGYIFLEKETQNKEKNKKNKQRVNRQQVQGVIYEDGKLFFKASTASKKFFLYRNGNMLPNNSDKKIKLEIGDSIFNIKNGKEFLTVTEHEIQVISEHNYAFCKTKEIIKYCEEYNIKESNYPEEVKARIYELIVLKQEKQKVYLDQNYDIFFCPRGIKVKKYKNYDTKVILERDGKLVDMQNYKEGDYIYVLMRNINNKHLQVNVCKIVVKDKKYIACNVDTHRIYYVNEIYQFNFSKLLREEIWHIFISNSGY